VNVVALGVRLNRKISRPNAVRNRHHRRQIFILDVNPAHRFFGGFFIHSGHSCNRLADVTHNIDRKRVFVLSHRKNAEGDWKLRTQQRRFDTVETFGGGHVDVSDTGVRPCTAKDLGVEHPGQNDIVGKDRLADALRNSVNFA
jgi:hypothetical protein